MGPLNCVFCTIPADRIVISNDLAFAIYDGFPVSEGHLLIIPKRHFPDFFDATMEEKQALFEILNQAKQLVNERFHPDGYNIGVNVGETAGQTVMHLHIHLIPRYKGDVENPRGGVRGVIPKRKEY
jgi:diadenosine tetraphosphate (Ap4A) HIT family hydrolase